MPKKTGHPDGGRVRHNPSEKNKNCFALPDFLFLLLWLVSLSITVWLALEYGVVKLNESWQTWSHYMLAVHDRSRIRRSTIN